jgi:hypothetical protein
MITATKLFQVDAEPALLKIIDQDIALLGRTTADISGHNSRGFVILRRLSLLRRIINAPQDRPTLFFLTCSLLHGLRKRSWRAPPCVTARR